MEICSPLAICFNASQVKASWMASPSSQTVIHFLLLLTEEEQLLTSSETLQDASPQAQPTCTAVWTLGRCCLLWISVDTINVTYLLQNW